jgi:hypothetical protein
VAAPPPEPVRPFSRIQVGLCARSRLSLTSLALGANAAISADAAARLRAGRRSGQRSAIGPTFEDPAAALVAKAERGPLKRIKERVRPGSPVGQRTRTSGRGATLYSWGAAPPPPTGGHRVPLKAAMKAVSIPRPVHNLPADTTPPAQQLPEPVVVQAAAFRRRSRKTTPHGRPHVLCAPYVGR